MRDELQVITHAYDLVRWTLDHTVKFPRTHRHSLGLRIEQRLYDLLDVLLEAKYSRDKDELLRRAALLVEQLRFQFRLALDLRILAANSQRHAAARLNEIGRQVTAWRQSRGRHASGRQPV